MECKERNRDCVAMVFVVDPWSRRLAEQQHWSVQRFDGFLVLASDLWLSAFLAFSGFLKLSGLSGLSGLQCELLPLINAWLPGRCSVGCRILAAVRWISSRPLALAPP